MIDIAEYLMINEKFSCALLPAVSGFNVISTIDGGIIQLYSQDYPTSYLRDSCLILIIISIFL